MTSKRIQDLEEILAYQRRQTNRWRGIAAAMGYEPQAHLDVRPAEDWMLLRIQMFRENAARDFLAEQQVRGFANPSPIPMVLHCTSCGLQHVDTATESWPNPPHRSHLCAGCGNIWRPADVPTVGVAEILTKGKADRPIAPSRANRWARCSGELREVRCAPELAMPYTGSPESLLAFYTRVAESAGLTKAAFPGAWRVQEESGRTWAVYEGEGFRQGGFKTEVSASAWMARQAAEDAGLIVHGDTALAAPYTGRLVENLIQARAGDMYADLVDTVFAEDDSNIGTVVVDAEGYILHAEPRDPDEAMSFEREHWLKMARAL